VSRIERGAVHDGPGLRTVVYLKGCPLRCLWCHSPETQSYEPEVFLYRDRCISCGACIDRCPRQAASLAEDGCHVDRTRCAVCASCADVCPTGARVVVGQAMRLQEVLDSILRDRVFFDQSGGGVTLSGGEPLLQPGFALALLERCRQEGVRTAVETCGLVSRAVLLAAAERTDLFLFDVKIIDERRHRELTALSNDRILDNLRALAGVHRDVIVRFPLLPGLNDDPEALSALGTFVRSTGLQRINVLPYHRAGIAKYDRLDRTYALADLQAPDAACLERTIETLQGHGLHVTVGGLA
jgi:pyruvate formate lyase activating enzyme